MIVGTEWLIEATGCNQEHLRDESLMRDLLERVITDLGLKAVGSVWHKFDGEAGITGLIALTESHLACHTYPEHRTATFNLYCCRTRPEWDWESNVKTLLGAKSVSVTKIERGAADAVSAAVRRPSRPPVVPSDDPFFKYGQVSIRDRGRLPHWEKEDGIYFVTFRLADSLPQNILDRLRDERREALGALKTLDHELRLEEKRKIEWLFSEKVDGYLDRNYGSCVMQEPAVAKVVADSLLHFDAQRYHLYAWCVMPNHVHSVVRPKQNHKLEDVLHSWKSYTAHEINKLLGRRGELWQREYYDHLVRSESDLERAMKYTIRNPASAGLQNWPWVSSLETYKSAA
ncbi:MAG: hypothetical protein DMF63_11605 [Acidobacteria bacterium]|nr:MAG: hypothetical protein DMF63_11605 [Acidobacteriota bacterium]